MEITKKVNALSVEEAKLKNVQVEMVIDLSSHQVNYKDDNAMNSFFMLAGENITEEEAPFVWEQSISGATNLGTMDCHHAMGADPAVFPKAANPK